MNDDATNSWSLTSVRWPFVAGSQRIASFIFVLSAIQWSIALVGRPISAPS